MGKDSFAPGRSLLSSAPHHASDTETQETNHERATFDRRNLDGSQLSTLSTSKEQDSQNSFPCLRSSLPLRRHQWLSEKELPTNNKFKVTPRRAPTSSRPAALSATTSRRVRATRLGTYRRIRHLQYDFVQRTILEMPSTSVSHSNADISH